MKYLVILLIALTTNLSCVDDDKADDLVENQKKKEEEKKKEEKKMEKEQPFTVSFSLKAGSVVETVFVKVGDEDALKTFNNNIKSLRTEFNGEALVSFSIGQIENGGLEDLSSDRIMIYQFPTMDKVNDFYADSRVIEELKRFSAAVSGAARYYANVPEAAEIALDSKKTYEVFSLWMQADPEKAMLMQTYFMGITPELTKIGTSFPFNLPVASISDGVPPSSIGLVEWESIEVREQFFESEVFLTNKTFRTQALVDFMSMTGELLPQ